MDENTCNKCNYKTKSKVHLTVHKKSCHKIIEVNQEKIVVSKKRKTIDENDASRKKTKVRGNFHVMSVAIQQKIKKINEEPQRNFM